jgi:hypothetical protein
MKNCPFCGCEVTVETHSGCELAIHPINNICFLSDEGVKLEIWNTRPDPLQEKYTEMENKAVRLCHAVGNYQIAIHDFKKIMLESDDFVYPSLIKKYCEIFDNIYEDIKKDIDTKQEMEKKVEEFRDIINSEESWSGFNGLRHASHSFKREFNRIFGKKEGE